MADGLRIDLASLTKFADAIEGVGQHFMEVGKDNTQLALRAGGDLLHAALPSGFVHDLWQIENWAVEQVALYSTVAHRGFHGIGYMATWFGSRVGDMDDEHARRLLDDARKAVPKPRAGLPSTDPRLDSRA